MRHALMFVCLLLGRSTLGQHAVEGTDVLKFTVPGSTIDYIKIGGDTLAERPVVIFLQGSGPVPLVIEHQHGRHVNVPFKPALVTKAYHLIVISMPFTPVVAKLEQLNDDHLYMPDPAHPEQPDMEYLRANTLETHVQRAVQVIDHLRAQRWVGAAPVHLIGHSQGAKVAAALAAGRKLASVALLGFNAYGRYDQYIRHERAKLGNGSISGDEYLRNIEALYDRWARIVATPGDHSNGHNSWVSFSKDHVPYLLQMDAPLFIGFGTEDLIAENCDLLPLEFLSHGKKDFHLKPYVGLDHNFFRMIDGQPDLASGHAWDQVIQDVLHWLPH